MILTAFPSRGSARQSPQLRVDFPELDPLTQTRRERQVRVLRPHANGRLHPASTEPPQGNHRYSSTSLHKCSGAGN